MDPGPHAPTPSAGAPTLVLVPSTLERERLAALGGLGAGFGPLEVCGVGPVAAGVHAALRLERLRPRRVLLLGLAGTFDPERAPVGSALPCGRVRLEGVGFGEGEDLGGPRALGLPQWGAAADPDAVWDVLDLATDGAPGVELLTVAAASSGPEQAGRRLRRHPAALLEDMEGFAVALACHRARVPLWIVRGVSNRVGDRDLGRWEVERALSAARDAAQRLLEDPRAAGTACVPHAPRTDGPRGGSRP